MSDILGHDIDGRPLKAGDEVIAVRPMHKEHMNVSCQIIGATPIGDLGDFFVDIWDEHFGEYRRSFGCAVRKIHNDHRPANYSFTEMMKNLKQVTA